MSKEQRQQWYEIHAKGDKRAEILIYEQIGENFWGEGLSAKRFVQELKDLGEIDDLDIRINSPGGNVFDGLAIYNALAAHKAKKNVYVDGIAASMASVVAMSGNTVHMPANAMMMIHDPRGGVLGVAKDMRKMADTLDRIKKGLVTSYEKKSGQERSAIEAAMEEETWYTAEEAVEFGLADVISDPVDIAASFDLTGFKNAPITLLEQLQPAAVHQPVKPKEKIKEAVMTKDELKAKHPDVFQAVYDEGKAAGELGKAEEIQARTDEAKTGERKTVQGLVTACFGKEAGKKIQAVLATGVTVEQYTAIAGSQPAAGAAEGLDAGLKAQILAVLQGSGAPNPGAGSGKEAGSEGGQDFMALVEAHVLQHKCSKTAGLQAIMKSNPVAHKAYLAKMNAN